jgi:hypothetical protein
MGYASLPGIRRARDYHLYTYNGKRYLDLYLGGGSALLGHKPHGLYKILKNEMQKGLLAGLPTAYTRRFEKALLRLAAGADAGNFRVKVYSSLDRALAAAERLLGRPFQANDIQEPFFPAQTSAALAYLRPCVNSIDYSRFAALLPVLPFPGGFAPQPLLLRDNPAPRSYTAETSDAVSPLLLAGLTRLTEELQTESKYPDIWKGWQLPGWVRFGCYCFPWPIPDDYARRVSRFLEEGVIISPDPGRPTLLPRLFSTGEQRLVERLAFETALGRNT